MAAVTTPANGLATVLNGLWSRYESTIDNGYQATPPALALYRIGFCLYLLLARPLPSFRWMASYPDAFYSPPLGLPQIWRGVPPPTALHVLEFGLLGLIALLLVGYRTPWTSLGVGLGGILANSAYFSFGKIEHTILTWMVPLAFSFSGWGRVLSLDERAGRTSRATPVSASRSTVLLGVLMAVAFVTAAVPKVLAGWLSFSDSMARLQLLRLYHQLERDDLLAPLAVELDSALFWEPADWGTIALELAFAVTLLWPVLHRRMVLVAWIFHLFVLAIMNIGFKGVVPVYPAFFLPLLDSQRGNDIAAVLRRFARRPVVWVAGGVGLVATAVTDGLWAVLIGDLLGLDDLMADLIVFLTGLAALVFIAVRTGCYRAPASRTTGRPPWPPPGSRPRP